MSKKYFWLKLHRDFFKRHDVRIMEAQENGKEYVVFYLKLLTESIDHEGRLRYSDTVPYDEKMLSIITGTNIDIVRSAVSAFLSMGLMERWDDGTFFMSFVNNMIGSETDGAARQRLTRQRQVSHCANMSQIGHTEIEKEIDKENNTCASESAYSSDFEEWWTAYPKKRSKEAAYKAWKKAKSKLPDLDRHIQIVKNWSMTEDWKKEGGQFIPYPQKWLSEGKWMDELATNKQASNNKWGDRPLLVDTFCTVHPQERLRGGICYVCEEAHG
jgi:predicted phage replisome organizer